MKGQKLFLKIYIPFVIVITVALIVLQILGSKTRIGYLTDFELNNFYEITNSDNTISTNYVYRFKIRYYDKVFRHSDIYGVYPDLSNLPDYIKEAKMDTGGSPFGNFVSSKIIEEDKIDNVNYILKIKIHLLIFIFIFNFIIIIIYFIIKIHNNIKNIIKNILLFLLSDRGRKLIKKLYFLVLLFMALIILIFLFLGNRYYSGKLIDFELIMQSPAGYVYKVKVMPNSSLFKPNFIYRYSDKPLKIENKLSLIKNYGYALEINRAPDWYNKDDKRFFVLDNEDGGFTVSNLTMWSAYSNSLILSIGEKYRTTVEGKILENENSNNSKLMYSLDRLNDYLFFDIRTKNIDDFCIYESNVEIYDVSQTKDLLTFYFPSQLMNIKSIIIEQINNEAYIKNNEYIILTSSSQNIENTNLSILYTLKFNDTVFIIILISIIPLIFAYFIYLYRLYKINKTDKVIISNIKKNDLEKMDYIFILILSIIYLFLFSFLIWLYFPGYFQNSDIVNVMAEAVNSSYGNANPVIIAVVLNFLYNIFGYHTFYLFLINFILFFGGLYLIILSLYIKFKNKLVIILLVIPFISSIHFTNIGHFKDYTGTLFLWMSYSLIFFMLIVNLNKKLKYIILFLSLISIFCSLLWRHNYIVMCYPMFIFFTHNIIKNIKNLKLYTFLFCNFMVLFAFLLILIVKTFPLFFIKNNVDIYSKPTGIFLNQIAACAVPNNDNSMIPEGWYETGKNFNDVIYIYYYEDKFNADNYATPWKNDIRPFRLHNLAHLNKVWIKYILRYPVSYIKYILNCIKVQWDFYCLPYSLQSIQSKEVFLGNEINKKFDNKGITFDSFKSKLYESLFIKLKPSYIRNYIYMSYLLFIISFLLFLFKSNFRNNILLLTISVSMSSIAISLIVPLFSPLATYRYIHPVVPLTIISLISFITFVYDRGGLKKFFKELRGSKK